MKKYMDEKLHFLSGFEACLITKELHKVKWEYDACEASESKMKAPESYFPWR